MCGPSGATTATRPATPARSRVSHSVLLSSIDSGMLHLRVFGPRRLPILPPARTYGEGPWSSPAGALSPDGARAARPTVEAGHRGSPGRGCGTGGARHADQRAAGRDD